MSCLTARAAIRMYGGRDHRQVARRVGGPRPDGAAGGPRGDLPVFCPRPVVCLARPRVFAALLAGASCLRRARVPLLVLLPGRRQYACAGHHLWLAA